MKNHKRKILAKIVCAAMFAIVLVSTVPENANASTITVPDDYITIQQAIDAASPGDEVYVRAGTYYEHATIGKPLILQGENRNTTIIDGGGTGKVIYITTSNVTVSGFTVRNSGDFTAYPDEDAGIVLRSVSNTLISDCIITLNKLDGMYGYGASYTTIRNSDISYNNPSSGQDGVYRGAIHFRNSGNCTIANNNIYENNGGAVVVRSSSHNTTVTGNYVHSNTGGGIHLGHLSNSRVTDNRLHNNGGGIHLDATTYCTVENNDVYLSSHGISAGFYARNNTIRSNILNRNTTGIYMGGPGVSGNKIYHNDMIENASQGSDAQGGNTWHDGYPSGGNYWSDYTGVDNYSGENQDVLGSDEIGDTPYDLLIYQDKYPLMRPWNILQVAIDIKPQSCTNPLNIKSKGVIPVAILGTEDFDVTTIDPATILLQGIAPIRWSLEDISTLVVNVEDCTTDCADGFMDLTLKFETGAIVTALGEVEDGEEIILYLTGELLDHKPIEGEDCVVIKSKGHGLDKQEAEDVANLSESYALTQNYPNPFNPVTTIVYNIPEAIPSGVEGPNVSLKIYDILGREIVTLVNEKQSPGNYEAKWNATNYSSGVYYYKLTSGKFTETKKMILTK